MTVLVAGAGPTGLATALFLARANQQVRIIDKLSEPANYSKAMALNPRSLELLEESGATPALLAHGNNLHYIKFKSPTRPLFALDIRKAGHRYSHLLGLPQSETERLLGEPVDFAVINYGGMRIPAIPKGPITRGKIFELMPFDNLLVVVRLDVSILTQFINHMAARWRSSS